MHLLSIVMANVRYISGDLRQIMRLRALATWDRPHVTSGDRAPEQPENWRDSCLLLFVGILDKHGSEESSRGWDPWPDSHPPASSTEPEPPPH